MRDREPQRGQVLEEAVEERGGDEQVGVLHVRDRLGDRVADAEPLRHPLGEAPLEIASGPVMPSAGCTHATIPSSSI